MARGAIPPTLPFVRREAVTALKASLSIGGAAVAGIAQALATFYRRPVAGSRGRSAPDIARAVPRSQDIYRRSVFPEMNVTFGTYPNNIGHIDAPGCFRCHDDGHRSTDGKDD